MTAPLTQHQAEIQGNRKACAHCSPSRVATMRNNMETSRALTGKNGCPKLVLFDQSLQRQGVTIATDAGGNSSRFQRWSSD